MSLYIEYFSTACNCLLFYINGSHSLQQLGKLRLPSNFLLLLNLSDFPLPTGFSLLRTRCVTVAPKSSVIFSLGLFPVGRAFSSAQARSPGNSLPVSLLRPARELGGPVRPARSHCSPLWRLLLKTSVLEVHRASRLAG